MNNVEEQRKLFDRMVREYEIRAFINKDPIKFSHRWREQVNREITGIIASWLAYGSRAVFLNVLEKLFTYMGELNSTPYRFIMDKRYIKMSRTHPVNKTLYRFNTYADFYDLCEVLHGIYTRYPTLEEAVHKTFVHNGLATDLVASVTNLFNGEVKGIPTDVKSACKRINMFLRWMIRKDSPVDLGCWQMFSPNLLLMPLDTHVARVGRQLNLITRNSDDMKTVIELTNACREIFPDDPCRMDFALFGYGIEHPVKIAKDK